MWKTNLPKTMFSLPLPKERQGYYEAKVAGRRGRVLERTDSTVTVEFFATGDTEILPIASAVLTWRETR